MRPYKVVRLRQNTPDWLEWRAAHIGASDAPIIVGESPYKSALELWTEKRDPSREEDPLVRFRIGHRMEDLALDIYEERRGVKLTRGRVLESRDLPRLSASLDAETADRNVEAKWSTSSRWDDGPPPDVIVQVMHQMAVSGHRVTDVAVLRRDDLEIHEVPFDANLWDGILALEERFIRHLDEDDPPPPDASESARRAIARVYPDALRETIPADAEMDRLGRLILDGRDRIKLLEGEVSGWENALRFLIGDHDGIEGTGWRATYRRNRDSERTDWKSVAAAYRKIIEDAMERMTGERHPQVDLDALQSIHTNTVAGPRVLRLTGGKG